jgi:hypothetical protein
MSQDRTHPLLLVVTELVRPTPAPGRREGNSAVKKAPGRRLSEPACAVR